MSYDKTNENTDMKVFVKNMRGQALMPCPTRNARILLRQKKAKIVDYKPFTIQLCYATGEAKQEVYEIVVHVDEVTGHIDISVVSKGNVIAKEEVELLQNMHSSSETRRHYYSRNKRYRKTRCLNRKRPKYWIPQKIRDKFDSCLHKVNKFCSLVPSPKLRIEIGKFDTAKMINPDIQDVDYQHGQCEYYAVRYFIFARDEFTCQVCKKKAKNLHIHQIDYKSEDNTNIADNLITVCADCHTSESHKSDDIFGKWIEEHKKVEHGEEPSFTNILQNLCLQIH